MYELIIHFFRVRIEEDASPSRRGELQVILYSINLPLSRSTEKLQTTVSCYTSTDHHHLMHTISTTPVVRCLEWRAHVIIFRCFFPIAINPLSHCVVVGCLFLFPHTYHFALSSSSSLPHGVTTIPVSPRCTGTKRTFRIRIAVSPILPVFVSFLLHSEVSFFLSCVRLDGGVLVCGVRRAGRQKKGDADGQLMSIE